MTEITCASFPKHGVCFMLPDLLMSIMNLADIRYTELRSGKRTFLYRHTDNKLLNLDSDEFRNNFGSLREMGFLRVMPWPLAYRDRVVFSADEIMSMICSDWPEVLQ